MTAAGVLVVGLGRVGSRFDEEAGRTAVWSHVGAYLAVQPRLRLVGGVETEAGARAAFTQRCPAVPLFENVAAACAVGEFSVASICTPAESHRAVFDELIDATGLKVIWCEKPMALNLRDADAMVSACRERDIRLVVSHVRRWHPLWQAVKDALQTIGPIRSLRVAMPNRVWSVGSHGIDLLLMMGGKPAHEKVLDIPVLREKDESARALLIGFENGAYGIFQPTGYQRNLLVEFEAIGDEGRLTAREANGTLEIQRFETSSRYEGYRELGAAQMEHLGSMTDHSPFVAIAEEVAELLGNPDLRPKCSGDDALAVQAILEKATA